MQIGDVIRKYRKEQNMTQEEMANYLGVTTPAVSKWENGNSYPDITLLAPIARLLKVSLDTLLSFQSELTEEEVQKSVQKLDRLFKETTYEAAFQWAKERVESYPNSISLIWQFACILDAQRLIKDVPDSGKYDGFILNCYTRVLTSEDEKMRTYAADSLFGYYLRREEYEKAEQYLQYFSEQNPERKRKQAVIYRNTGKCELAYQAYEELLFSGYQMLSIVFHSICMLAMQEENIPKARKLVEKQKMLASLFEMGKYYEFSCELELAIKEEDKEKLEEIQKNLLDSVEAIADFVKSDLYEHMKFKSIDNDFFSGMRKELQKMLEEEKGCFL